MIKVSVVIPMYNVEEYLEECIESTLNQSLEDIEIICVNDGSTDSSLSIARKFEKKDKRVKVIDKKNGGYGHTMNRGFDLAQGEYIAILESDDFMDTNMLEDLYMKAKENDLDFIKADFNRFIIKKNGELELTYNRIAQKFNGYYDRIINPSEEKLVFRFIMNTWSGIYKREFIEKYKINHNESPGASYQDNGFFFKTFCNAEKIMFVNKPYYMNRRDNVNSSVHNKEKVYCVPDEYKYIREYLESVNLWDEYSDVFFLKKFHNYRFTFTRVGDEFKNEFLEYFSNDFRNSIEKGEIDKIIFTENEWRIVNQIAYNMDEYFKENTVKTDKSDSKNVVKKSNYQKVNENLKNFGIINTLRKIKDKIF